MLVRRFPFTVGRAAGSHLMSGDSGVWDEHFQIDYRSAEGLILRPAQQSVTLINSEEVSSPVRLTNGAEITAGAMRIRFSLADAEVRSYRYRELATWFTVLCVVVIQVWLLVILPK